MSARFEHIAILCLMLAASGSVVRAQDATAAVEKKRAREQAGDQAASALIELRAAHLRTRQLFGDDHVSLIPLLMARTGCGTLCGDDLEWRAAGVLHVPLLGLGGSRPAAFWPRLETDQEAVAYMRFERRARDLSSIVVTGSGDDESSYDRARAHHQY